MSRVHGGVRVHGSVRDHGGVHGVVVGRKNLIFLSPAWFCKCHPPLAGCPPPARCPPSNVLRWPDDPDEEVPEKVHD